MLRQALRAKIHKATVTDADLNYIGSITIDRDLMDIVDFWEGEKVLVVDNTNGARLETYVIAGERGSGIICMNGAASHLINKGDEIIVIAFAITDKPIKAKNILVDENNRFVKYL
jgi:aspartate 1-decarboxylase